MSLEARDRGGPIQKFWEDEKTNKQLESVKTWLLKSAKKVGALNNFFWSEVLSVTFIICL